VLFVQEELTKAKLELAKTKEEVSKLKTQLQAATKTTKEEEKAKAKIAAKIQSLEAENGRLTSSVQAKTKELKQHQDTSEKLDAEVTGLKTRVEVLQRELASAQAAKTTVRKQRDRAEEEDDDDDYGNFVPTKKSRLSLGRPPLEAMIQKQVAEALKNLVPQSQQAIASSSAEGYQLQPLQQHPLSLQHHLLFSHQQQQHLQQQHLQQQHLQQQHLQQQHMDPTDVTQRSFEPYQGRAGGHQAPVPPPVPHHVQTATTSAGVLPPLTWPPNPTTWSSSPIEVAVNTPLAAALTSTTAPQQPTQPTRTASPVGETAKADNASAQMFKAFMEFMATQKLAPETVPSATK
jgi:hypothetical protein